MHKIRMVVRREYLEQVRKKSFWIGTLAFPAVGAALFAVPIALQFVNPQEQKTIAFVDATGRLAAPFVESLEGRKLDDGRPEYVVETVEPAAGVEAARETLEPRVAAGELYGVLTAGPDIEAKDAFAFYAKNVGNIGTAQTLERALKDAVVGLRLERSAVALDRATLDALTRPIDLESYQVSGTGEAKKKGFIEAYLGTYFFVFLMYFVLFFYGFSMARGVIQEKSNRVMEVLLGSLTPTELMTGKILGIGLVGLTQVGIYAVTGAAARFALATLTHLGDLGAVLDLLAPLKMLAFVVYFVLGYFMYTSMFAIVGAACNTEQEAQNLQTPVILSLLVPMISTIFFVQHPDSTAAAVVSLVPLFTPMVMFMRISTIAPPPWQIALSIVLMLGTIWLLFRAAAKVFRIGTLMYGKRPSIGEILRWARSA